MFQPNCVVVLPAPELAIKSDLVRGFMEKKLKKNILHYLKHFNTDYERIISHAGRMIILSKEPKQVISSLSSCFGLHSLFLAQEVDFSSLEDLCTKGVLVCEGLLEEGTFAVCGKSFSKDFKSKKLEEELGSKLLEAYPKLKVKLKSPKKEVFCISFNEKAYFYFDSISGAKGMPVGSQGKAGLIVTIESKEKDLVALGKNLLKTGCSLVLVSDEKMIPSLKGLEEFNCFESLRKLSVIEAKQFYSEGEIRAFFSTAKSIEQAEKDSALFGVKVFVPLLE